MKFSRQLQFIAVDRWRAYYIDYKGLKKKLKVTFAPYINPRYTHSTDDSEHKEQPASLPRPASYLAGLSSAQSKAVDPLETVSLVRSASAEFRTKSQGVEIEMKPEKPGSSSGSHPIETNTPKTSLTAALALWNTAYFVEVTKVVKFVKDSVQHMFSRISATQDRVQHMTATKGSMLQMKREVLNLSVDATELLNFVHVNSEGFRKILKKFAKVVSTDDPETGEVVSLVSVEREAMEEKTRAEMERLPVVDTLIQNIHTLYVHMFSTGRFALLAHHPKSSQSASSSSSSSSSVSVSTPAEDSASAPTTDPASIPTADPASATVEPTAQPENKKDQTYLEKELLREIVESTEAQVMWKKNTILGEFVTHQQKAQIHTNFSASQPAIVDSVVIMRDGGMKSIKECDGETEDEEEEQAAKGSPSSGKYFAVKYHWVAISFVVLIIFAAVPWAENLARQMRCLGLLIWASILWAVDGLPTHVTALFVPVLATFLNIVGEDQRKGAAILVKATINNTPFLAIGGYSIALAMRNTGLDVLIASSLLKFKIARNPIMFLLIATGIQFVLTTVISNISSTVLVLSITLPVLREVPVRCDFSKMLLMTIAASGNLAGMITPLASPQSMVGLEAIQVAMGDTKINFGTWTLGALPVTFVSTLLCFGCLFLFYKLDVKEVPLSTPPPIPQHKKKKIYAKQAFVGAVSLIVTVFWFITTYAPWLGNEAIVGLIPTVIFFGFNLIPRADIVQLPWGMILLVMGGAALGETIKSSQLLQLISELFGESFATLHLYVQLTLLTLVVAFVSIFVSHAVAALVLLPIVNSVMVESPEHIALVLMACALHVSPPMILSVASFPNMCAAGVQDDDRIPYVTAKDFLKYGGAVSILGFLTINTVFYGTGLLMGL